MAMVRAGLTGLCLLLAAFAAPVSAADPRAFADCGLERYDETLPRRMLDALALFQEKLDVVPASTSGDMTSRAYATGVLTRTPGCDKPNVRFFAGGGEVAMEIEGLGHRGCERLRSSPSLRRAGAAVVVRDLRTGQPIRACVINVGPALFGIDIGPNLVRVTLGRAPSVPEPAESLLEQGRALALANSRRLFGELKPKTGMEIVFRERLWIDTTIPIPHSDGMRLFHTTVFRQPLRNGTPVPVHQVTRIESTRPADAGRDLDRELYQNCHGTTFGGGSPFIIMDAIDTILDEALEKTTAARLKPGDVVLWISGRGPRGRTVEHSATVVRPARDWRAVEVYQSSTGIAAEAGNLGDLVAAIGDRFGDWAFYRIRDDWPG